MFIDFASITDKEIKEVIKKVKDIPIFVELETKINNLAEKNNEEKSSIGAG